MSVDRGEVLRIARLARLRLDDDELERMTDDLNSILEHVDALGALEDDDVPDDGRWAERRSTRASEETVAEPERLDPSSMAPAFQDGFFVVPPPPGVHAEEDSS
ncbi:MAG: Asp-tRNA(Asn)/Glu-tRNA(Gln) amidotransferase subunit GatC [Gemmatimonadota bacterium]